jgi:hypothetical protein
MPLAIPNTTTATTTTPAITIVPTSKVINFP